MLTGVVVSPNEEGEYMEAFKSKVRVTERILMAQEEDWLPTPASSNFNERSKNLYARLKQWRKDDNSLWESAEAAAEQMRSIAPMMDLIKISAEECPLMTGETEPELAAKALLEGGASVVCVTLDADGAFVATHDGSCIVPSFRVDAVDTTGAGDSFWGGFLAAFVESGLAPADIKLEDAAGFTRFGNAVASLCVRKRGAIPAMPTRDEVLAVLA